MPIFSTLLPSTGAIRPDKVAILPATAKSSALHITAPQKSVVAEPANRPPATHRVSGRGAYSTPSILDALSDVPKAEDAGKISEVDANQYSENTTSHSFSEPQLLGAWKNFVSTIESAQLKSALGAREPIITDAWQIEYELDTELQFNRLALDLKPKLQSYLRNHFQNDAIEIQFKVSATASHSTNIPYTDAERWSLLAEKFPALAALKSKFGLDFEHF